MLFNLRHLHAAIEIQRLGSITLAAESENLSQSAMTHRARGHAALWCVSTEISGSIAR